MKMQQLAIAVLTFLIATSVGYSKVATTISNAVLAEMKKYPKLEIQDLYKLAFQAAMGNEHMMSDASTMLKYLNDELASIDTSSREQLIEYLTSDSLIIRVNLRAFKAQKGNPEKLLEAMRKTASTIKPSLYTLRRFWNDIEELSANGKIPFKQQELSNYFNAMEQQEFPAVHHSKIVEESYKPAYRIISKETIPLIK